MAADWAGVGAGARRVGFAVSIGRPAVYVYCPRKKAGWAVGI
jgi:hypothetical protein